MVAPGRGEPQSSVIWLYSIAVAVSSAGERLELLLSVELLSVELDSVLLVLIVLELTLESVLLERVDRLDTLAFDMLERVLLVLAELTDRLLGLIDDDELAEELVSVLEVDNDNDELRELLDRLVVCELLDDALSELIVELDTPSSCRPSRNISYVTEPPIARNRATCDTPSTISKALVFGW